MGATVMKAPPKADPMAFPSCRADPDSARAMGASFPASLVMSKFCEGLKPQSAMTHRHMKTQMPTGLECRSERPASVTICMMRTTRQVSWNPLWSVREPPALMPTALMKALTRRTRLTVGEPCPKTFSKKGVT